MQSGGGLNPQIPPFQQITITDGFQMKEWIQGVIPLLVNQDNIPLCMLPEVI